MNIYISKQDNNSYAFFYDNGEDFFTHKLSVKSEIKVQDDDIFRLALITNPFPNNNVNVSGVVVSSIIKDSMSNILNTEITCDFKIGTKIEKCSIINDPNIIYLGFSGGFDSLAAKAILPKECQIVSIDYGGNFSREKDFFIKFPTNIVEWDLRNKRLNSLIKFNESANWRFMLAPLTLFREDRKNIVIATGTVLEASPFWFDATPRLEMTSYSDAGFGTGISVINPVSGLTEFSTALIVQREYGDLITEQCLKSIAHPNSFKVHRKRCLLAATKNNVETIKHPINKYIFGTSFADDFLSLYFCWKFGVEWTSEFYASGIPNNIAIYDMSFTEKLNENNLLFLDKDLRKSTINNINNYGIESYSSRDYENLDKVRCQLL